MSHKRNHKNHDILIDVGMVTGAVLAVVATWPPGCGFITSNTLHIILPHISLPCVHLQPYIFVALLGVDSGALGLLRTLEIAHSARPGCTEKMCMVPGTCGETEISRSKGALITLFLC